MNPLCPSEPGLTRTADGTLAFGTLAPLSRQHRAAAEWQDTTVSASLKGGHFLGAVLPCRTVRAGDYEDPTTLPPRTPRTLILAFREATKGTIHLMSIRILIVDDHPLLRQGLIGLISTQRDLKFAAKPAGWPKPGRWRPARDRTWRSLISP